MVVEVLRQCHINDDDCLSEWVTPGDTAIPGMTLAGETALGIEQRAASREPRAASMEQYFIFSLSIFSLPANK